MRNHLLYAALLCATTLTTSCSMNRVEPNNEGVLMTNYGRNGQSDFKLVTGSQGFLGPGSDLYQVPMYEQKADPSEVNITARDGGKFSVDPTYSYQAIRGQGASIVFNYKHVGLGDDFMNNIEKSILDPLVLDTYREAARKYTTDYLIKNMGAFETSVQDELTKRFASKWFTLTNLTSGLTPPASMGEAIEKTNNAVQEAEQVKNQLAVAKMLQEKATIEAQTHRIESAGLTKEVLQARYIDAILRSNNRIIITDGKTPVFLNN
jgi:hypothetical protein